MKKVLPVVLLTFVNTLGFSLFIPVFPFVVEKYGGGPIMFGVLLSIYSIFQFLGAPVLGAFSDRYGRRPIILISFIGTLIGWLIFALAYFAPNYQLWILPLPMAIILFARVIDGITGGNNSVAVAFASDITTPEEKTKVFGLMGGVLGVGLLVGPALGGLTGSTQYEYLGTVLLAAAISCGTLIYIYFFMPESLEPKNRVKGLGFAFHKEINLVRRIRKYTHNKYVLNLFFMRAFFTFVFMSYTSILVLYVRNSFGLNPKELGLLFLFIGSFLIFNQVVISPRLARRYGNMKTFVIGLGLIIIGLPGLIFVGNLPAFILNAYVINLGISCSMPTFRTLLTTNVDRSQQGEVTGIDESILAGASAISPLFASILYAHVHRLVFFILSLILTLALTGFIVRHRRWRTALIS